jgi:hypothetical protein
MYGIDKKVQFRHKVNSADWSSAEQAWSLSVNADGTPKTFQCRFMLMCTGYYDYDQPLSTVIPGIENFAGKVVHPSIMARGSRLHEQVRCCHRPRTTPFLNPFIGISGPQPERWQQSSSSDLGCHISSTSGDRSPMGENINDRMDLIRRGSREFQDCLIVISHI